MPNQLENFFGFVANFPCMFHRILNINSLIGRSLDGTHKGGMSDVVAVLWKLTKSRDELLVPIELSEHVCQCPKRGAFYRFPVHTKWDAVWNCRFDKFFRSSNVQPKTLLNHLKKRQGPHKRCHQE